MKKRYTVIISVVAAAAIFSAGIIAGRFLDKPKANPNRGLTMDNDIIVESDGYIGEEKAKEIALEKAGFSASEIDFIKVEFDRERSISVYEVEFRKDRREYSAEINADTGEILDWEVDYDD